MGELFLIFVCLFNFIADLSLESLCLENKIVEDKVFDEMLKGKLTIRLLNEHINAFD